MWLIVSAGSLVEMVGKTTAEMLVKYSLTLEKRFNDTRFDALVFDCPIPLIVIEEFNSFKPSRSAHDLVIKLDCAPESSSARTLTRSHLLFSIRTIAVDSKTCDDDIGSSALLRSTELDANPCSDAL